MIAHGKDIKVFTGNSNPKLAQNICQELGIPLGDSEVGAFSDGENFASIYETVRGSDVFVVQSTCSFRKDDKSGSVNDALMELLIMIDALRRAGCTHFLKKPITRKDLRVLTLRLAPVSRRFKDTDGAPPKTAPKPQAPSAKGSPRVSPDIPNLPELPEPAKPLAPALSAPRNSHAAEPAPVKRGIFASLFARFRKQAKPAAPEAPTVVDQVDEPVMSLT